MTTDAPVIVELVDTVTVVTINRPHAANALNAAALSGLWDAVRGFNADERSSVMVLTGAGDRVFCAGQDLKELAAGGSPGEYPIFGHNVVVDKPIIAAVNGVAAGGGLTMVLRSDLCVSADTASFAVSEARWGRGLAWAADLLLLVPPRIALELCLTAAPISALRAYEIGLVNRVVAGEDLLASALEMARTISANAPLTVRAAKRMAERQREVSALARREIDELWRPVYESEDAKEGPLAFSEKRRPQWRGR